MEDVEHRIKEEIKKIIDNMDNKKMKRMIEILHTISTVNERNFALVDYKGAQAKDKEP